MMLVALRSQASLSSANVLAEFPRSAEGSFRTVRHTIQAFHNCEGVRIKKGIAKTDSLFTYAAVEVGLVLLKHLAPILIEKS
jgi:hypothetical protein